MDNLFVVVEEYDDYQFKQSKVTLPAGFILSELIYHRANKLFVSQEETLTELQQLASKLPWTNALEVWKLNRTLKKKKGYRKGGNGTKVKPNGESADAAVADTEQQEPPEAKATSGESQAKTESAPEAESSQQDSGEAAPEAKVMKFRVTCNRAGDKHSFSSNEAARDFGGAVQEFFQWKADMTKFDIEVGVRVQTRLTQSEYRHITQAKENSGCSNCKG